MSFKGRDIRHFTKAGVSLGVDVKDGMARVTICAVNFQQGDKFSRPTARRIIQLRLDGDDETLRFMGMKRRTVSFPYSGHRPRTEIIDHFKKKFDQELLIRAKTNGRAGSVSFMMRAIQQDAQKICQEHTKKQSKDFTVKEEK